MGAPVIAFDAIKLTRGWVQRPRAAIEAELAKAVADETWVIEGGPSLLPIALRRAEAVIWLDPPLALRAWRLLRRPWRHRGTTRPELPDGNVDRIGQQYRFAWHSLRADATFRADIKKALEGTSALVFQCRRHAEVEAALSACADRSR